MSDSALDNAGPEELFLLAQSRPDLWGLMLEHPHMYPGLAQWIREQIPSPPLPPVPEPPEEILEPVVSVAPVVPAVPAVPARPQRRRALVPTAIGVAFALVLVYVVGGGIFWFLRGGETVGDALGTVPTNAHVVTFGNLQGNATFTPIGAGGELYLTDEDEDERLVLINRGGNTTVVAVATAEDSTDPAWTKLVDGGPCAVDDGGVACGADIPAGEKAQSDATPMSYSHQVGAEVSTELPYSLSEGKLYTEDGTAVESTFEAPLWALPGKHNIWMISDGTRIVALDGTEILWSVDLSNDDALINGFGTGQPNWATSGDVVLYAIYGALIAQEISTGDVLWQVEIPLTSYQVARDTILVSMGDALALIPLDGTAPDPTVAPAISEAEDADEELQTERGPAGPEIDPEDLFNGTIQVSAECHQRVTGEGTAKAYTFNNGLAEGLPQTGQAFIEIADVNLVNNDGAPYALAWLICDPPELPASMEIAVYNAKLELVQSLFMWSEVTAIVSNETKITSFDASDNEVSVTSAPWLGFGDEYCLWCSGEHGATVDYTWSGGQYVARQVSYDTPSGTVVAPDLATLNNIYNQVANGSESTVMQYFSGSAVTTVQELDTGRIGGAEDRGWYFREIYFSPGGRLTDCNLVPPEETIPYFKAADTSVEYFSFAPDIHVGDFACLVTDSFKSGGPGAHVWWLVRPTTDPEDFSIYEIGRDFS